jgi:hypothetical protein
VRKRRTHDSDAEIGRFLSQDTFLGDIANPPSLHLFAYANANPVRYIDWSGLAGIEVTGHAPERLYLDQQTGMVYVDLPTASESVQVRAYATRGEAVSATLDVQLARPVQRLEYPVSLGMRGAGATGQAVLAVGLALTPEPTMATKAGAVYFAARSVDEFQALGRELYTGQPTASFAQQGATALVEETTGLDPETASTVGGLGLSALDLGVGLGTIPRATPTSPVTESLEGLGRSAKPKVITEAADNVGQALPATARETYPTKVVNGRTYELRPSRGGAGPRRWQRVGNESEVGSAGYSRDLVAGDFQKNAAAVRERDPSCQYCQAAETTGVDHAVPVYDVDAAVGAGILTRDEGIELLNELDNLLGACTTCNSSKGAQLPGNIPGTWMPQNPSSRAIDIMRRLGSWRDE